ncbi:MAG: dual specificity protein phosphatase family protein [Minisyncoccia bacterium]
MRNKIADGITHVLGMHGFDYSQVTDEVFIGTNMCCQFGFAKELLTKGVYADVSLEEDKVDAPLGVEYFVWLPTVDGEAPTPDKFAFGVETLEFLAARHIKTFIHCKNGHGRAPTLFAAYLIKQGMSLDAAISLLKEKRPVIHFSESQMKGLHAFEASLK